MARRRRGSGGGQPFIQVYKWLWDSEVFNTLGPYSKLLYLAIRKRYNGNNNGDIPYSYREAEAELNCSNKPIPRAFRELQERGFIVPTTKGAFSWKRRFEGVGRATTWRLTELPQDYPMPAQPTLDFKQWKPGEENKTRHAESGPYARPKRAISTDMARPKRANGTPRACHSDENAVQHGTPKAGTYKSTISPTPIGETTTALMRAMKAKGWTGAAR